MAKYTNALQAKKKRTERRYERTYDIRYCEEEGIGLAVYSFLQAGTRRHQTKGAGSRVRTKEVLSTTWLDYGRDTVIQEATGQLHGEGIPQEELNAEMEPLSQEIPGVQRIVGLESLSTSLPYSYTFCFQFHLLQPYCVISFPLVRATGGKFIMN